MSTKSDDQDVCEIKAIVRRQFESLSWSADKPADWQCFSDDFHPTASLYPASRPAERQTVVGFLERMKGLAESKLTVFDEQPLGTEVQVFGRVASAVAACKITENQREISRGVEMLLLVKDDGRWRIVAQAWDLASGDQTVPGHLMQDG